MNQTGNLNKNLMRGFGMKLVEQIKIKFGLERCKSRCKLWFSEVVHRVGLTYPVVECSGPPARPKVDRPDRTLGQGGYLELKLMKFTREGIKIKVGIRYLGKKTMRLIRSRKLEFLKSEEPRDGVSAVESRFGAAAMIEVIVPDLRLAFQFPWRSRGIFEFLKTEESQDGVSAAGSQFGVAATNDKVNSGLGSLNPDKMMSMFEGLGPEHWCQCLVLADGLAYEVDALKGIYEPGTLRYRSLKLYYGSNSGFHDEVMYLFEGLGPERGSHCLKLTREIVRFDGFQWRILVPHDLEPGMWPDRANGSDVETSDLNFRRADGAMICFMLKRDMRKRPIVSQHLIANE
jgi:hypothetical protein